MTHYLLRYVPLFNIISFSISFVISMSAFYDDEKPLRYIVATIAQVLIGIATYSISKYSLLIYTLILVASFAQKNYKLIDLFCSALSSACFLLSLSMLVNTIEIVIKPKFFATLHYNILMGLLLTVGSLVFKKLKQCYYFNLPNTFGAKLCLVIIELLGIVFLIFIIPWIVSDSANLIVEKKVTMQLIFVFILISFSKLINDMNRIENKNIKMEEKKMQSSEREKEYKTLIELKHYYHKLYAQLSSFIHSNDLAGLKDYYTQYIEPIHDEYIRPHDLNKIKNFSLKLLIEHTLNEYRTNDIDFSYKIHGSIEVSKEDESDIYRIVSEWIDNATKSLENSVLTNNTLTIEFIGDNQGYQNQCTFKVINSLSSLQYAMISTFPVSSKGLNIIKEIIFKNPRLSTSRMYENKKLSQMLFYNQANLITQKAEE